MDPHCVSTYLAGESLALICQAMLKEITRRDKGIIIMNGDNYNGVIADGGISKRPDISPRYFDYLHFCLHKVLEVQIFIMEASNKTHDVTSSHSGASVVEVGTVQVIPEKISFGKKLLYHLWDADQHLKSPQVRLKVNVCIKLLICDQERALVRKLDFGILICATLGWVSIHLPLSKRMVT